MIKQVQNSRLDHFKRGNESFSPSFKIKVLHLKSLKVIRENGIKKSPWRGIGAQNNSTSWHECDTNCDTLQIIRDTAYNF